MKELFTKKIYYKKFNHRLAIMVRRHNTDNKSPTPEVIEWLLNRKFPKGWRGMTSSSYATPYRWGRKPDKNLYTVFFKDPEVYNFLQGIIGQDYFDEFEKPMDEQHTQMLEKEKVVTRTKLFYDKYRIALRVPAKYKNRQAITSHLLEMKVWCNSQFGQEGATYRTSIWTNGTFYFAEPKDAIMFKLVWGEDIKTTERVVLISEMEAAREEASA